MSRSRHSKHGGKGPGYEYWSPRPGPRSPGKDNKIGLSAPKECVILPINFHAPNIGLSPISSIVINFSLDLMPRTTLSTNFSSIIFISIGDVFNFFRFG